MRLPAVPLAVLLLAIGAPEGAARGSNVHVFDQTTDVWDGSGGPWLTGHVYLVKALVTVPAGQMLTIQPGVTVKFDSGRYLSVKGTLSAVGTSGSPIRFTSLKDDAVGGDHNGDGAATAPAKGDWRRLANALDLTLGSH